jgi:phosphoserine phosphatase RsbU/P
VEGGPGVGERVLRRLLLGGNAGRLEDLPPLAMRAAAELGVEALVIYLVDYAQTYLAPFTGPDTPPRDQLAVDGTLAGRAYALGALYEGATAGEHHLWIPITDGSHRIGVLEVVADADAPPTPDVRETCTAIAAVLAGLVSTRRAYTDSVENLCRGLPMQVAAEIVWSLLPPLTFAAPEGAVAGILEPCYEIGGDAFDYATNGEVLHVALFDAVGHGISASALTTVAVNAYRSARRCGLDLMDSCRSIDKWVNAQFPNLFVTGVLAELDLRTGLVRAIFAGHPGGMLLRGGQLVKHLPAPTALPMGLQPLSGHRPRIHEEALQPGDHLLLYTDGVVEARDGAGEFFGTARLADFVVRTLTDKVPASETMRRLVRAILEYQHERLQDDATAVLVHWNGPASGGTAGQAPS